MGLKTEEEAFVAKEYNNDLIKKQIKQKHEQMWQEVNTIMSTVTDGTQWKKRKDKKDEYKLIIEDLENQIVE